MKLSLKLIFCLGILFSQDSVFAQKKQSSCDAPVSVHNRFKDDADYLALNRIIDQNLSYRDSFIIPKSYSDTILKALIAVYNLDSSFERDTVIDLLKIHTFKRFSMNRIVVCAHPDTSWMKKLKVAQMPTGDQRMDDILLRFGLRLVDYVQFGSLGYDMVTFETDKNRNLIPLRNEIAALQGVKYVFVSGYAGDGVDVKDSVFDDHVKLIFKYGWGDCPSGCTSNRFWEFDVFYDCTVDFKGSYGDTISEMPNSKVHSKSTTSFGVYPNPFVNEISLYGCPDEMNYTLYDSQGKPVSNGKTRSMKIIDLETLNSGIYFLRLEGASDRFILIH